MPLKSPPRACKQYEIACEISNTIDSHCSRWWLIISGGVWKRFPRDLTTNYVRKSLSFTLNYLFLSFTPFNSRGECLFLLWETHQKSIKFDALSSSAAVDFFSPFFYFAFLYVEKSKFNLNKWNLCLRKEKENMITFFSF